MMQSLMIESARLAGVQGAATVYVRKSRDGADHRGTFWFRAEHDEEIRRLLATGAPVELVGLVAGSRKRLTTRVISAEPNTGLAIFEGSGEPTPVEDLHRNVAG